MKRLQTICLLVIISTIFALPIYADSPVWKISKGKQHLYIGGTIHLLSKDDYPLPSAFDQAYKHSAQLVLETDLQAIKSPEFAQRLLANSKYNDGRTLRQVLKPKTFKILEQYLSSRGIPIENMLKVKPGIVALTLTMVEFQRLDLANMGVDEFYSLRAVKDQKTIKHLETIDQQLAFITEMGAGQEDEMITYTLRDMELLPDLMQSMKGAWRVGDNRKLQEIALIPFKKDFPKVYSLLLTKRNDAWLVQIETMLKTQPVELVLVGALHLVGDDGVLAKLLTKGYKIQKL